MHETRLERVQNVGTGQSLAERLLRIGTVNFDTAAEEGFDFRFRGVENPLGDRAHRRPCDRRAAGAHEPAPPDGGLGAAGRPRPEPLRAPSF